VLGEDGGDRAEDTLIPFPRGALALLDALVEAGEPDGDAAADDLAVEVEGFAVAPALGELELRLHEVATHLRERMCLVDDTAGLPMPKRRALGPRLIVTRSVL
jgi:hypothetical protein